MALGAVLVDRLEELRALADPWQALAAERGAPYLTPSWALAWWRHLRPDDSALHAVAVRDGEQLVGLLPAYLSSGPAGRHLRMLGDSVALRVEPLAAHGREWEVAGAVADLLARSTPQPDAVALDAVPLGSPWPALLRERWPGPVRPVRFRSMVHGAPTLTLEDGYDAWFAGRSGNFRSQLRRAGRQLEQAGGRVRPATAATLRDDLEAFARLHAARWEDRGPSPLVRLGAGLVDMLADHGAATLAEGGSRVFVAELDGEPIAVQVLVATGGEVAFLNGGWSEEHAKYRPAMLALLAAVEDAGRRGDRRVDLGGGEQGYKLRFATGNDPLGWGGLVVPGPRLPVRLARIAPRRARWALGETRRRVRRARSAPTGDSARMPG